MNSSHVKILPSLFLYLALLGACMRHDTGGSAHPGTVSPEVISRLNTTIEKAPVYQERKIRELDSLKSLLKSGNQPSRQWEVLMEISSGYRQMNTDSAMTYARRAMGAVSPDTTGMRKVRSQLALVMAVSTAGIFPPALQMLDSISKINMPREIRVEFWKASRMLYSYMMAFVSDQSLYEEEFLGKYIECDDSLLTLLPENDSFRRFIFSERLVTEAKWEKGAKNLEALLRSHPKESNIYGMAAYQLALVNKNTGNHKAFVDYLALSAESDIKGCVKEGIALPALAKWLYEDGRLDDAFNYINFALEEANSGNMRMRTVSIGALIPLVDEAYRKNIHTYNTFLIASLVIATTLLIIAIVLSAVLVRNMRISRNRERKLSVTSKKLEAYIGNFIGLCSTYASRLEQFAKLVTRKINAGQTDDLLKMILSGKANTGNDDDFYRLIDKAILDLFPDFVANINTLLRPECRIELKPDEFLTPELRIYAFVRLGVDQSTKIAQILNYSTNTVYAYRNRMRNRAISHDTFDADVAKLSQPTAP